LRLNGHSPEAVRLLQATSGTADISQTGDWVVLTCVAEEKARVVEALVHAGISILDFRVEEASFDAPAQVKPENVL
jgi:hypothetical protein